MTEDYQWLPGQWQRLMENDLHKPARSCPENAGAAASAIRIVEVLFFMI
jgi:hypothetical protein